MTGTVGFDGLTGSTGAGSLCLDSNKQVVYNSASDNCLSSTRATKHDINPLVVDALSQVLALQPVSFVYNDGDGRTRFGFIAEDTAAVDPHLVTYDASSTVSGIDDRSIIAILVGAIKDLYARVQEYFARTEALEERVSALEAQLAASAAAGAPETGSSEAPSSSSAQEANPDTDTATTTTSSVAEPSAAAAGAPIRDTVEAPAETPASSEENDSGDEPEPTSAELQSADDTLPHADEAVENRASAESAEPAAALEPADNLSATGAQ